MRAVRMYNIVIMCLVMSVLSLVLMGVCGYLYYRLYRRTVASIAVVNSCDNRLATLAVSLNPSNVVSMIISDSRFTELVQRRSVVGDNVQSVIGDSVQSVMGDSGDDVKVGASGHVERPYIRGAMTYNINGCERLSIGNRHYGVGDCMRYGVIVDILPDCVYYDDGSVMLIDIDGTKGVSRL